MFVTRLPCPLSLLTYIVDSVVLTAIITIMTRGRSMFQHESGLSYNALGLFPLPVKVMLLPSSMMLCMSLVAAASMEPIWVT